MRRLPVCILALLLALAAVGCDSGEEDLTDAEIFIGSWTVVQVTDSEGDKTSVFAEGVQDFSATISGDGTYTLSVDFVDPERQDIPLQGNYTLDEGAKSLVLNATLPTGPVQLPFQYSIQNENQIALSLPDALVEGVFGTQPETYTGTVTFMIERV